MLDPRLLHCGRCFAWVSDQELHERTAHPKALTSKAVEEAVARLERLAHEFQYDGENKTDFAVSAAYANAARIVRNSRLKPG